MTREEAKIWLNKLYARADITDEYGDMEDMQPYEEAVNMTIKALEQEPILEVDEAMKLGRKRALEEVYEDIRNLFNYRIRIHNRDYENAKSEQYKYDLSRDAREFNANFNMVLDCIKERIEAESEE